MNERILEICAGISCRSQRLCPREALGVTAAPRGSITGALTLLRDDGTLPQRLDRTVISVPGDPEAIRALQVESDDVRARCVLVIEKDSVFRRLIDDGFIERLPCVLVTACGFPDLATRAMVQHVVDALQVPCFALADYNPHGVALMLCYKLGSASLGLESYRCPSLQWLGLHASDLTQLPEIALSDPEAETCELPEDAFQSFTTRDRALVAGLLRRPCVLGDAQLHREVRHAATSKPPCVEQILLLRQLTVCHPRHRCGLPGAPFLSGAPDAGGGAQGGD